MPQEELNTLIVTMLGGFSLRYNGKEISLGNLNGLQMVQFLQLLLHFRTQGVSRDLAKSVLFGDRYRIPSEILSTTCARSSKNWDFLKASMW